MVSLEREVIENLDHQQLQTAVAPSRASIAEIFQWRSLKTRVTLLTLSVFVICIWLTACYASWTLRDDMQRLLGEQQFATASLVARTINDELEDRLRALDAVAKRVSPRLLGNQTALQTFLEDRPALQGMFNAGIAVLDSSGTAIASLPVSVGRVGVNYMERDYIAAALKEGRSSVSQPTIAKLLNTPVFGIAAPIRDEQGKVIGVFAGLIDLGKPNFLDQITQNRYGKTGGYLLVAPQHKLVVTGTDKSRIMTAMPAPGINPLFDRYAQGYEGFGTTVDSRGLEVLSVAKQIPVAGWLLVARIPAAEAFAPIHEMQRRLLLAATLLTLLAGTLIWWILRRQLAPMLAAANTLTTLSQTNQPPQPMPITRQDEIGDLIGGFNGLLEVMGQRTDALRESEERYHSLFNNSHAVMMIIDPESGAIVTANPAAAAFYGWTQEQLQGMRIEQINTLSAAEIVAEMQRALAQQHNRFEFRHRLADGQVRDVEVLSGPVQIGGRSLLYSIVHEIGARKQAEALLVEQIAELRRWQQATLGRENRVLDMKREVNRLLAEHGQPPRYPSAVDAESEK